MTRKEKIELLQDWQRGERKCPVRFLFIVDGHTYLPGGNKVSGERAKEWARQYNPQPEIVDFVEEKSYST